MSRKLSDLEPGEEAVIVRIVGSGPHRRRMMDMGLVKDARIKVVRKAPLKDPVEYELKGYRLSLRREEAENVLMQVER